MYKVAIRNNKTKEIRLCDSGSSWNEHSDFWWLEGNMSCDCNRHLLFERAGGREPELEECKCSDGMYSVLYAEMPDGTRIVLEGD
jgi:hypothetical protein